MAATETTSEQAVLDSVPASSCSSAASGATRTGGGTLAGRGPGDGRDAREVADATVEDAQAALAARRRGVQDVPRTRAARARRHPAARLRADHRAHRRARAADDARDGQAARRVQGRDRLRGDFFRWYAEEAVRINGRFTVNEPRRRARADDAAAGRARACSSRPGTSRWRWAPARSARRSPPAARWSSSRPSRRRCRCSRSAGILEEAGLPGGVLNVITVEVVGRRSWSR